MFTVIYSFHLKKGQAEIFERYWKELTLLIYEYEGSLGSRLHKNSETNYIAYAQWPDKETWANSGKKLPAQTIDVRNSVKACCDNIETLYELDVVTDLLAKEKTNSGMNDNM